MYPTPASSTPKIFSVPVSNKLPSTSTFLVINTLLLIVVKSASLVLSYVMPVVAVTRFDTEEPIFVEPTVKALLIVTLLSIVVKSAPSVSS